MKTSVLPRRPNRTASIGAGLALLLSLACGHGAIAQTTATGQASAPNASKDDLIRELVGLTDAAQLEAVFSRQFIDRVANAVAFLQPTMDPATMTVIRQEATDVIHERIESGDALYSVLYPVYEKHFNIFELNELVTFYESPLGQKLVRVSPQLLTESLSLGREWGLSLVPEIIDRVQTRLANQN
ncbi:DUF2059 domain-containing protein [Salinisphaera aquimarina]|uniref:DUF2059 domain-containing protein n=1 Tax=Salinisphaera aquimarina TaxID=2094031 RepID=A0ABV7EMH5_9GAMM